jgi:flagellar biosynthesis protein FlhF
MNVRKFFANTSRQALQLVRQGMGPDALILSNRPVDGGVEILALAQADLPPQAAQAQPAPHERQGRSADSPRRGQAVADAPRREHQLADSPRRPQPVAPAAPVADPLAISLASEFKSMRGVMEEQLVYQAWDTAQRREPGKARVLRDMLHAGFSAGLARQFLAKMPAGLGAEQKLGWVKSVLERNLRIVSGADEIVERGGTYALVGPTGVGKTTTVAKIAARCVVRYGADRLALLTTDGYRIGAHEQLRIYGKLLGVRVIAVKDASDLQFVLDDLRSKHLVLIDTVGMSQRDEMVAEQLAMLSDAGSEVQRLLLLNATGNGETLDDVVRVYHDGGVHGCIITKTDEAVGIATALDVAMRHHLALHYVTDGQRVPEDLHLPDREYLLQRALRPASAPTVHHLDMAECQLMLATASAAPSGAFAGARFG